MTQWYPATHDPVLLGMHGCGLTDREITIRMLDAGHSVSIQDIIDARRRLGLKPNKHSQNQERQSAAQGKPNPLAGAKLWLGRRLVEKQVGDRVEYRLDNCPTNLTNVMRAYNRMRVNSGAPQIDTNPAWRVQV